MSDSFFVSEKRSREEDEAHDIFEDEESLDSLSESDEESKETPAEKRLRLAKEYIENMRADIADDEIDAAEIDKELIASRMLNAQMEEGGRIFKFIASNFEFSDENVENISIKKFRGHRLAVTAVCISENEKFLFTASKDSNIIKWDLETGKKLHTFGSCIPPKSKKGKGKESLPNPDGHFDHILALAVSSDGKYLASAGKDKQIHIWDAKENKHLKCFKQHRKAVTGLAFRKGHNQLYSSSLDRTIKIWNIDELSYVETLFGHQDGVVSIDSLSRENCVTVGLRDRTVRLFKIIEESQLVFRASIPHGGSLDVVKMLDENCFASGSDNGTLCLWNINKKKPTFSLVGAHSQGIISLATVKFSDLLVSGSSDGSIKFWKLISDQGIVKKAELIGSLSVDGYLNSLSLSSSGKFLGVSIGQEPRLGRWGINKNVQNSCLLIDLTFIIVSKE
ncbi:WD40 repeat-like protein [Rozella allomycis CSF55]|uniref:WD40 repeat-like protein n=1 Tax=Rozella allomycis (strain CSF55) TaxID=988480 RepID=A0A4P9YFY1_ROZAC|nr:WD40 repeat-like protein [Rozella allomycis CSF55]